MNGTDRAALLTQRQAQVVSLLAAGKSTREVARALGVTPHTLQAHIGMIMKKLGVANRLQVIAVALRDTRGSSGGKSKPRRRN
jgi:DNA-binding CsgD family transcriptional regulator